MAQLFLILVSGIFLLLIIRKPACASDYDAIIADACSSMEEDLEEFGALLEGSFDYNTGYLNIAVKADDKDEIYEKHLEIFYDIFYYLPIETDRKKYRFEFITYTASPYVEENEAHRIVLETDMTLLPSTGGVTRKEWERFTEQLLYKYDGEDKKLKTPDSFVEE